MKPAEKTVLYRELAKLTQADFHLDRSVDLLLSQKTAPAPRAFLEGLKRGLEEGKSLTEAIRSHNQESVSGLDLALMEAGERSGKLSAAFNHLARYYASADGAAKQMRGAMIYPLILLHLAIILPELPSAIVASDDGPGFLPKVLLSFALLWAVVAGVYFLWRWLSKKALTSAGVDTWLNRAPWIGPARRHWALARFCQVFHAGLLAGLRMSEICRLAGEAAQSGSLRAGAEVAARRIEAGETLSMGMADAGTFDALFVNSVATAEEVGKLDEEMARWTTAETISAAQAMEKASLWLPKMGYFLVVLFVGYRIISMVTGYYSGIFQLIEQ
ncbi:type II secretion system F family protein [Prosthecobacter sp. SYSU 5D2]|uniref:type II secretion system F family protein n=1 Tax=Prosthecobacter sp. SYSU 5D2 TaxID=3134134 RepID=UPI0031FF0C70